jgi:hypothetical protein
LALAGGIPEHRQQLRSRLSSAFTTVEFHDWEPVGDLSRRPGVVAWLGDFPAGRTGDSPETDARYEDLPPESRLDASSLSESPEVFLSYVLQAALGI